MLLLLLLLLIFIHCYINLFHFETSFRCGRSFIFYKRFPYFIIWHNFKFLNTLCVFYHLCLAINQSEKSTIQDKFLRVLYLSCVHTLAGSSCSMDPSLRSLFPTHPNLTVYSSIDLLEVGNFSPFYLHARHNRLKHAREGAGA